MADEQQEAQRKTETFKDFKAMNSQDERYGVEKDEWFWLENIQPIGPHKLASIPGPGATFVTLPGAGSRHITRMFGVVLSATPFIICATDDTTVWVINVNAGTITQINGAEAFNPDIAVSIWQGTTALIVDKTQGYFAWPLGPGPAIAAIGAAGNVNVGNHQWAISYVDAAGNIGGLGALTAVLNVTPASHVSLTGIPLGPVGVTARKVYRNKVADQANFYLVGTIADNTTTTFDDNVADAGLGATNDPLGQIVAIDKSKVGVAVSSYSGRAWISNARLTQYTAPGTFTDFDGAHAAGSFVMTDSAFIGNITASLATLDVLWLFGESSINQLSNVVVPASTTTTTFSNVNISSSVGTILPLTLLGWLRQVMFCTKYGVIQQIGVTPQRVSDKIDGTFAKLDLSQPVSSGIFVLNDVLCYGLMATYADPDTASTRKILIVFTQDGKWFVASQGDTLTLMASVETGGNYRAFGTDGILVKEMFTTATAVHKVKSPLFDFDDVTAGKEFHRAMLVLEFPTAIPMTTTLVPQSQQGPSTPLVSNRTNLLVFIGSGPIQLVGAGNVNLNFVGKGYALQIWSVGMNNKLIGFDASFNNDPFYILAYAIDYQIRESWGDVRV